MNQYQALKEKQQAEVEAFPMFFAFNRKQFEEGMRSLGLKPTDTAKIYKLGNTGGFYRKSDSSAFHDMFTRQAKEREEAIAADPTGDGYIFEMFDYELANHEYNYTHDPEPTLRSLGLTMEMVKADPRLLHGWQKATRHR